MQTAPTLDKRRTVAVLDCSRRSAVLIPVTPGKALRVHAQPLGGVTLGGSFTLRSVASGEGGGELPRDFSPARTIAGGGGVAVVTAEELSGITEIEVVYSHSSYTAHQHAEISATLAVDVVPLSAAAARVGNDQAFDDVPP